jgi:hypothetical protein
VGKVLGQPSLLIVRLRIWTKNKLDVCLAHQNIVGKIKVKQIIALPLLLVSMPAISQVQGEPIIVSGICDPKSGVTIDGLDNSQFSCDGAIIARTQRGTVLIQFIDKSGDDGRLLGFAGTIEGKQGFGADSAQMMSVERIYLAGGSKPVSASHGTCIMNWSGLQRTGGVLNSIVCAARGQTEGADIKAVAMINGQ